MRPLGLAVLLLVLLTAVAQAEPTLDSEEDTLWALINDHRQAHSVQPVGLNENLMDAAAWMADDMATNDRYSHTDSLGRSWPQRMADFGYAADETWTGEVLAAGRDAQEAFDAWMDSPEHNSIMLSNYFWAIGIARAYDETSTHGWYWTVDFGGRGPAWFPPTPAPTALPAPTPAPTATPTPAPVLEIISVPVAIPAELPSTGTKP